MTIDALDFPALYFTALFILWAVCGLIEITGKDRD